ncbi:hypothetical protein PIROE2DRAFT_63319 [Piromyces sp. E2]|nr:hypothetical protein PIROE2DRAFT_63319 [Piromyces sp. E2]|eukprot:OUM60182.1 hypothetical protein PIROE2DRAFT_63319 [Piromyces sp. E2]
MSIRNETRRPLQNNALQLPQKIEKLQKKLMQVLETNYEVNKKYGNMLSNNESSSPKPYPSLAEQKRIAAIVLLRKRTNNIVNGMNGDSINSYRKGSVDDYLITHNKTNNNNNNNKVAQRQQALSVLMRRVGNTGGSKKNDNLSVTSINTDFRKYSYDSHQSPSINNSFNSNRFDIPSPNPFNRSYDNGGGSFYNSMINYDMNNSPSNIPGIPSYNTSMEATHSPNLTALKAYDMNNSNISNSLSPISPTTNFMNSFAASSRKSVNLGSVAKSTANTRIFENNRLVPNDLSFYDINSCPTSPIGNFAPGGSFFNNNGNRIPSSEELSQKIAENQIMIDYLSKLCMSASTGDINEKETSLFTNNMLNTTKLPPAYLNNDINISDYTMQSPPFTSSSSNHSSPTQVDDNSSPFLNQSLRKFSLNDTPSTVNSFPTPYVNTNKVITSNITMPSSPYLGNSKVSISPCIGENGCGNATSVNSPKFSTTPSSSPYVGMGGMAGMGMDKSQATTYKRNQSNAYVNNLMGRGIPSPSPSFTSNGNGNSRFMINKASPGLYPTMNVNDISPPLITDNASFDLQPTKFNSKSVPSSPSFGFNEPSLYQSQNGNGIPSVMEQQRPTFYNNKLNTMMSSMYNNNSVQKSQSIIPAYTSTPNVSTTQMPSPNIGAIGRPSVTKLLLDDDELKNTNPLSSLAFEKQKKSPPLNGDNISDDFSKLSLGQNTSNSKLQNFHDASALLSSGIPKLNNLNFSSSSGSSGSSGSNIKNGNDNDQELSVMEPNPNLFSSSIGDKAPTVSKQDSALCLTANSNFLNGNSDEKPYKLFDNKNVYDFINNTTDVIALNNFESLNAVQNQQSLVEDSPLINTIEDKNFNTYNIDMQMTSDAFSNNSNNNNMFSLSVQHPVLS